MSLEVSLREVDMRYIWLDGSLGGYGEEGLGEVSPNEGWESGGFRNYADHALSEEFRKGLEEVLRLAEGRRRAALICAEKHYWRCHRRIISDLLVSRGGVPVVHIVEGGRTVRHGLTGFAVVRNGVPFYPPRSASYEDARSKGSLV